MLSRKILGGTLIAAMLAAATILATSSAGAATAPTKDPVVVIGGMGGSGALGAVSYVPLMGRLSAQGYQVSLFTTPDSGLGDIHANAARLSTYVDGVRAATGSAKVDIVTHSQGGLIARDYVKTLGGSTKVDSLVMLAPTNYGTALSNLANAFLVNCVGLVGCSQQATGSPYLNDLNAGDDSIGSVRYTSIISKQDEVVIPYTSAFLNAADGNITNVAIQNQCPFKLVGHGSIIIDGAVADGIFDALKGEAVKLNCWAV